MRIKYYDQRQLENELEKERKKTMQRTIEFCNILAIWAVWDSIEGIRKEQIQDVLRFIDDHARDYILSGEVKISEIAKMLKDETGITVTYDKEYFR